MAKASLTAQEGLHEAQREEARRPGSRPILRISTGREFHAEPDEHRLDAAVVAYGSRPCTYFIGRRLTYAEIGRFPTGRQRACRRSASARASRLDCCCPTSPTFVIFYHGVLKAGGTVVNFNPLYSVEEIEFQAGTAAPKSW